MNEHPRQFILNWIDDLFEAFAKAERECLRPLDRGAPREEALRRLLTSFLPGRYGVTSGHVVSAKPDWSRQADVIIYNALESPVLSRQSGFQGDVLPVEGVHGILEVKSTLTPRDFQDALEKVAQFKNVARSAAAQSLEPRFAGVFFFRYPEDVDPNSEQCVTFLRECLDMAQDYELDLLPDLGIVLGATPSQDQFRKTGRLLFKGTPTTPKKLYVSRDPDPDTLPNFLWSLMESLRRVPTGFPRMFWYLRHWQEFGFLAYPPEDDQDAADSDKPDEKLPDRLRPGVSEVPCPFCGATERAICRDAFVVSRLKGQLLGEIESGVGALGIICEKCGYLSLHLHPDDVKKHAR